MDPTLFQYCQKIVIFRNNYSEVLLAQRAGEADLDGLYGFIGGKLETPDSGFLEGLRREKNEEIGEGIKLRVYPELSANIYFVKSNGQHMLVPHVFAEYLEGEVMLNSEEYAAYRWVKLSELEAFEPKIDNTYAMAEQMLNLKPILDKFKSVEI